MAQITTSILDELLKNLYAGWEIEQLVNVSYPTLNRLAKKGSAQLGGNGFFFPVRAETAHGFAYITETQVLPTGRNTVVRQAEVDPTVFAGRVELSGLSMAVSQSNAAAFARAFDENVQQTIESMYAYKEGVMFRDGSGQLGVFNGNPDADAGPHVLDDVSHLREGMYVDVISAADNSRYHTGIKVTLVDWVNKQVTFDTSLNANVADNDLIFITGSQAASGAPVNLEPVGFEGAFLTSGEYLGINRSSYPNWQSLVFTASGLLDEDILMRARTRLTQETGIMLSGMGSKLTAVCHPMQADILFKLAVPRIKFTGNDSIDLGYGKEPTFGGMPFVTSYLAPADKVYIGDFSAFQQFYVPGGELHIDSEYNGAALKWVANYDIGLVFLKEYAAMACRAPHKFIRIVSLTQATR